MAQRIQLRRGTAAEWAAANPVLAVGEPGVETDTGKQKFGNGTSTWTALPYASKGDPGPAGIADDASVAALFSNPNSQTRAAGNATYVDKASAASTYSLQGVDSTQRFMALLNNEQRDTSLLYVGDSTGNEAGEWIRLHASKLAADWPRWKVLYRLWDDTAQTYGAAETVQAGTGTRTLTIYNASVPGFSTYSWQAARADAALYSLTPDLIVLSLMHNEQVGIAEPQWFGQYVGLTESLTERLPGADLVCVAQNPETANNYQQQRREVVREVASRKGYGFIDVTQAFLDYGADLTVDGIHPGAVGSQLWADTVHAAFKLSKKASPRPQQPSTLTQAGEQLLKNGDFSTFTGSTPDQWTLTNATAAKDTTNYESGAGYSVKITGTAAGATLTQYVPINRVKGRWVNIAVRMFVPAGAALTVGRIGISDSTGSTLLPSGPSGTGGFRWLSVTRFIPATATNCRAIIYADSSAGLGNVSIDRVVMTVGKYPHSAANAQAGVAGPAGTNITQMDHLSTLGTSPTLSLAGNTQFTVGAANQGICVPVIPHRDCTINTLRWMPGVASGNYDIAILDATGTRLWSKGSTALTSGAKVETVSPGVALTAGTKYWIAIAFDNTTAQAYGLSAVVAAQGTMMDGTAFARTVSSMFPIPATVTLGTTGSAKIPNVVLAEA
ncbi:GDSL-type esterase/lipase family protein [Pseudarthrobacter sp. LMD1-1-1.1]|uniref:hyaluronate lyase N-terminal domain-containing protein n=1 Tax=Pseudarthrobacter sp. LMD1-1-1.1 TaxID=3135242 RepID=UPI0034476512